MKKPIYFKGQTEMPTLKDAPISWGFIMYLLHDRINLPEWLWGIIWFIYILYLILCLYIITRPSIVIDPFDGEVIPNDINIGIPLSLDSKIEKALTEQNEIIKPKPKNKFSAQTFKEKMEQKLNDSKSYQSDDMIN